VSTVCYIMYGATASTACNTAHTMTSTTSFNIDSDYRIDTLCEMVLGLSEYQQAGGSSESNIENSEFKSLSSY
jgi:hypothetical protein